jgi:hypothetical protein
MPPSTDTTTSAMPMALVQTENRSIWICDVGQGVAVAADHVRLRHRHDQHIDQEKRCQQHTGQDSGRENLADGFFRQQPPDDHQDAGRNQHAQATASGHRTEGKTAVITMAFHLRIGDARKGCGGGNRHPRDKGENGVAQHCGNRQASRYAPQAPVDAHIDVGHGSRLADEFPHQHEQRYDGKFIGAQGLIGGIRQHLLHDHEVAGDQVDSERAGDPQGNGDVNAQRDQDQQADDQDERDVDVKHGPVLSS